MNNSQKKKVTDEYETEKIILNKLYSMKIARNGMGHMIKAMGE